uniref:Movement protein TGBp3 n=1 Tax=Pitahaya virus E TaxID=3144105 RepID=A0AAU6WJ45_9VIRU
MSRLQQATLNLAVILIGLALGMFFMVREPPRDCTLRLSGESVTLTACKLDPALIEAISKLEALKGGL